MANHTPGSGSTSSAPSKKAYISTWMMAIMIITTVLSLRGLASQAEFGWTSIFWYALIAIIFLIPYSLVCAELGSTWTKSGGIFRWVSEGLGPRWGLTAMFCEWMTIVIWFPSVLMFASVAIAYIFWPESFDTHLASNKIYTIILLLGFYWAATLNTFRGIGNSNKLGTIGGLFGTIIPGAILIILGIIYVAMGKEIQIIHGKPFFPDFREYQTIVLAASVFLFYGGMEMMAVHVTDMKNPSKTFPRAIFLAVILILAIFILATLAIAVVVPQKDINLLQTLLVAYNDLWGNLGVSWIGHIMAAFIAFGVLGQISVIIAGPSTGLFQVGKAGYLPKGLQKSNKHGVQVPILMLQSIIVTVLTFVVVVLPSVQSAYQILSQLATLIYLVMVVLIYIAFIRLRITRPHKQRGYKIPGGNGVAWFITIYGLIAVILAMLLSFFPPSQISTGSPVVYIVILIVGLIILFLIPILIYASRKKSWVNPDSGFPPFDWQLAGVTPGTIITNEDMIKETPNINIQKPISQTETSDSTKVETPLQSTNTQNESQQPISASKNEFNDDKTTLTDRAVNIVESGTTQKPNVSNQTETTKKEDGDTVININIHDNNGKPPIININNDDEKSPSDKE